MVRYVSRKRVDVDPSGEKAPRGPSLNLTSFIQSVSKSLYSHPSVEDPEEYSDQP